ncbi:hypothetical protein MIDIC_240059 [Alphaproteobacteria bacterium]
MKFLAFLEIVLLGINVITRKRICRNPKCQEIILFLKQLQLAIPLMLLGMKLKNGAILCYLNQLGYLKGIIFCCSMGNKFCQTVSMSLSNKNT